MNLKDTYKLLERNKYYIFSLQDLLSFYPDQKRPALKKLLYSWKKNGSISYLKKGLYELTYPDDFVIPDMHIANKLYSPSYVSLETALSKFGIIPEVSMAVTSVTTKPTRKFKNKHGLFIYHSVRPKAFCGYYVERQGIFEMLIAEPEKALVDYLYFKTYRSQKFDPQQERLDKDRVFGLNKKKLKEYAQLYGINLKEFYARL